MGILDDMGDNAAKELEKINEQKKINKAQEQAKREAEHKQDTPQVL